MPDLWNIHSNKNKSRFLALVAGLIGIALAVMAKSHVQQSNGALAAFWLGVMLIAIAAVALLEDETITITVDTHRRELFFLKKSWLGQQKTRVPFTSVEGVAVRRVGRVDQFPSYHLQIRLKNGRHLKTGRWSFDLSEINDLGSQLVNAIGCPFHEGPVPRALGAQQAIFAAIGAVIVYVIWYRFTTGQICPAMWFGTAPPVVMGLAFLVLLSVIRRWPKTKS